MYELLIPLLAFLSVAGLGGAVLAARADRRQSVRIRLHGLEQPNDELQPLSRQPRWARILGRVGAMATTEEPSAGLGAELAKAGYHGSNAPMVYLGAKILLLVIGLAVLAACLLPTDALALSVRILLIAGGAATLFFVPNVVVQHRRNKRRNDVRAHLADVIDLMEVCVSAGMGWDAAWNSVSDEIQSVSTTLADEMALTNLEIHLGAQRAVAMRHLAGRTGAQEIASLVSVLVQSDRFGTSIADALRAFATSMRELRSQRAEEAAEKMPVKLLFPLVLLVFPAVLIVLCGPAGIEWARIIAGGY